jgi:hypothetical protein
MIHWTWLLPVFVAGNFFGFFVAALLMAARSDD